MDWGYGRITLIRSLKVLMNVWSVSTCCMGQTSSYRESHAEPARRNFTLVACINGSVPVITVPAPSVEMCFDVSEQSTVDIYTVIPGTLNILCHIMWYYFEIFNIMLLYILTVRYLTFCHSWVSDLVQTITLSCLEWIYNNFTWTCKLVKCVVECKNQAWSQSLRSLWDIIGWN